MPDEPKRATYSLPGALANAGQGIDNADPKLIVSITKELFKRSEDFKLRYFVPTWLRNLYFYLGFQHINWNAEKRRWYPAILAPDTRTTVNRIRSMVNTIAASFVRGKPTITTDPRAATPQARSDARMQEKILRYVFDEQGFDSEERILAINRAIFGGAFLRVMFDPKWGQRERVPRIVRAGPNGDPVIGDDGNPVQVFSKGVPQFDYKPPPGQARAEVRTPFEIHMSPSAREPRTQRLRWVGEKRAVPVEDIYANYGVEVNPDTTAVDITSRIALDLGKFFDPQHPYGFDERMLDSAWVYELHYAADDEDGFEEGRKIVVIADKVITNDIAELPSGRLPIEYFPAHVVPLRFHGSTPEDDMIEPQRDYNTGRGHVKLARSAYAFPWVVYDELAISEDQITSGARLLKRKTGMTDAISFPGPTPLNNALVTDLESSKSDIGDAGGQSAFSRGSTVGASPQPFSTVQALMEADLSDLQLGIEISEEAMGRVGEYLIELVNEHYDTERLASIIDEGDDIDSFKFSGVDAMPGHRVRYTRSSEIPQLRDSMRTQFMEAAKSGVFSTLMQDPAMNQYMIELFEMPAMNSWSALSNLDVSKQEREITKMVAGIPQQRGPFDDDKVHLMIIARFTKSAAWEHLDQSLQRLVIAHGMEHKNAMIAQAQQAAVDQAAAAQAPRQPTAAQTQRPTPQPEPPQPAS